MKPSMLEIQEILTLAPHWSREGLWAGALDVEMNQFEEEVAVWHS